MIFVLENIRSGWNVGSIFRTADALGASLALVGYTPRPTEKNLKIIKKTAIGAEETVAWEGFDLSNQVFETYPKALHLAIEISENSLDIKDFSKNVLPTLKASETCLWFGNEIRGVDSETLARVDYTLHLPMKGKKESLNVATSVAAAGYILDV